MPKQVDNENIILNCCHRLIWLIHQTFIILTFCVRYT